MSMSFRTGLLHFGLNLATCLCFSFLAEITEYLVEMDDNTTVLDKDLTLFVDDFSGT